MGRRIKLVVAWGLLGIVGTFAILFVAMELVGAMVPVYLPSLSVQTGSWNEYASAQGTWTMDNDELAAPLQSTNIVCRRYNMTCTAAQAEISSNMLHSELYDYEVMQWDNDVIIFKNTSSDCVDYTYTINRVNERVIATRTTKKTQSDGCLVDISPKPINLTLTDGFKVYWQLYEEGQTKVFPAGWMAFAAWWIFIGWRLLKGWRTSIPTLNSAPLSQRVLLESP